MMKRIIQLLLWLGVSITGFAQQAFTPNGVLSVAYGNTTISQQMTLTYHYELWRNWSVYGGLKYLLNGRLYKADVAPLFAHEPGNEYTYFTRINATTFGQHFGVKLGAEKVFPIPGTGLSMGLFYDFQFTKTINNSSVLYWKDALGNMHVETPWPNSYSNIDASGRFYEHHAGLTVRAKASERLGIKIIGGLGGYWFSGPSAAFGYNTMFPYKQFVFSRMLGLGIEYRIK